MVDEDGERRFSRNISSLSTTIFCCFYKGINIGLLFLPILLTLL